MRGTDRLRKTRAADSRVTVQTFLVEDHRNSEPGIFHEKFLNRIRQFGRAARVLALARVAGPAHLPKSVAVLERGFGLLQIKIALGVRERLGFFLPDAHHLRGFFLQCHARQQVLHAFGGGQRGIFINWNFGGGILLHARFSKRSISITFRNGAPHFNRNRMENSTNAG